MAKNSKKIIKTFIIIATMEISPKDSFADMFLQAPNDDSKSIDVEFGRVLTIDRPVIISPKGFKSLEVIPVDDKIVIHGIDKKRVIMPP